MFIIYSRIKKWKLFKTANSLHTHTRIWWTKNREKEKRHRFAADVKTNFNEFQRNAESIKWTEFLMTISDVSNVHVWIVWIQCCLLIREIFFPADLSECGFDKCTLLLLQQSKSLATITHIENWTEAKTTERNAQKKKLRWTPSTTSFICWCGYVVSIIHLFSFLRFFLNERNSLECGIPLSIREFDGP